MTSKYNTYDFDDMDDMLNNTVNDSVINSNVDVKQSSIDLKGKLPIDIELKLLDLYNAHEKKVKSVNEDSKISCSQVNNIHNQYQEDFSRICRQDVSKAKMETIMAKILKRIHEEELKWYKTFDRLIREWSEYAESCARAGIFVTNTDRDEYMTSSLCKAGYPPRPKNVDSEARINQKSLPKIEIGYSWWDERGWLVISRKRKSIRENIS
jgi:hypothetical protein